ncbi:MAG: electron transfer flavoprotein subunit alpha/FixB family protein [Armatimonadota bacterium]|nr:electron transfer flavoprotein subunit alpha/FixB family protein [Armatimonadota bacterium]
MSATSRDVWIYVEHLRGTVAAHTYELLGKGREIAAGLGGRVVAVVLGEGARPLVATLGAADSVLCVDAPAFNPAVPEAGVAVLRALAEARAPRLVAFGATSVGMDLATLLSARLGLPLVVNCKDVRLEDGRVVAISQMCGGKLLAEVEIGGAAILTVLAGAFPVQPGMSDRTPPVEAIPLPTPLEGMSSKMRRLLEPEPGDVDITKAEVLVGVGRGIQRKENLALAEELAGLLGGTVCASRPVIDQGWLPLNRQVGKSGMVVRPKLYVALGISGAPEHVEGMKDSDLIIAINTDAKAPIFDVADYGAEADLLEVVPALVEELKAGCASAA